MTEVGESQPLKRVEVDSERHRRVKEKIRLNRSRAESLSHLTDDEGLWTTTCWGYVYRYIKPCNPRLDRWSVDNWIMLGMVMGLVVATSLERVSFKMAVDDMIPFRYMLLMMMLICSTIANAVVTGFKRELTVLSSPFYYYYLLETLKMHDFL